MFDIIIPEKINSTVHSFFTKRSTDFNQAGAKISGLNLGFNTPDSREVVLKNRADIFSNHGIDSSKVVFCNQVHGTNIVEVSEPGLIPDTDGLITNKQGLGICILVADCAAVLMHDDQIGYVAALHAGWRGAVGGIVPKCLELFKEKGSNLSQVTAFVSPCISEAKFEVGFEVADQFPEKVVNRIDYEKPHVDLKRFLELQFESFGVDLNQVQIHDGCTLSQERDYYSFRRNGKESGRMMGFIQLK